MKGRTVMNQLELRDTGAISADPTVRDLVVPLFRRKRLWGISLLGLLLLTIGVTVYLSNVYKCSMEVLVNRERLEPTLTSEATNQTPTNAAPVTEEDINSEVELLQSPDLLRQVVLAVGLERIERKAPMSLILPRQTDEWYAARATERLGKRLDIEVVKKTNMILVSYKSSDPKIAYGVLDKLAGLYMEKHLTVHRPIGSYDFFAKQTDKYRQALADSEMSLVNFGKTEGVVAPDVQRTDLAQVATNSVGALHQAEQAIAADEDRIIREEAKMKETPSRSPTLEVSNAADLLLQGLEANLLAAQIKKTQLSMKYEPSYPLVQEVDREIAQTQAAIADAKKNQYVNATTDRDPTYELLREDVAKTQADLASQKATAKALKQSIQSIQGQMVSLDQQAVKQGDLLREVKADESNYLLYLSKREQERTSDALDQKRIGNVAIAVPPTMPILPAFSPLIVLALGSFLSVFLSIGGVFILDSLDSSFRTPAEVLEILQIPVLASLPKRLTPTVARPIEVRHI
jgi:uncharacterized protein involved in exopolysaccharide biosynthesis